jgi:hypothetical protein
MDLEALLAREAIRDTLCRYNLAGDRGRLDELVACFSEDGVLEVKGEWRATGAAEIRERTGGAAPDTGGRSRGLLRHHLTTQGIELLGPDAARAWSYFLVLTEAGPDHAGRYADQLRKQAGGWLLTHRRVVVEWWSPNTVYPSQAARAAAAGSRG